MTSKYLSSMTFEVTWGCSIKNLGATVLKSQVRTEILQAVLQEVSLERNSIRMLSVERKE